MRGNHGRCSKQKPCRKRTESKSRKLSTAQTNHINTRKSHLPEFVNVDILNQMHMNEKARLNAIHQRSHNFANDSRKPYQPPTLLIPKNLKQLGNGLNLEGICINTACTGYYMPVVDMKGFGNFNMTKECYKCKCPECGKYLKDVDKLILKRGRIEIEGEIEGTAQEIHSVIVHDHKSQFQYIIQNLSVLARGKRWSFLELKVNEVGM